MSKRFGKSLKMVDVAEEYWNQLFKINDVVS